jgi:transmembrane sensor
MDRKGEISAQRRIADQAAAWVARGLLGSLSPADQAIRAEWLAADPAHQAAYDEVVDALSVAEEAEPVVRAVDIRARKREHGRSVAGRAALVVALLLGGAALYRSDPASWFADVRAGTQVASRVLPDGSRLWVDAGGVVDLDFSEGRRDIAVRSGRIFVEAAHLPGARLAVRAAGARIEDIGTAFSVAADEGGGAVRVTQGVVAIDTHGAPMRLTAGQGAAWRMGADAFPMAGGDDGSWRSGRLVVSDEPLESVVARLNRYSLRPILLVGAARTQRVNGVVRIDAFDNSLAELAESQHLRKIDLGFTILLISQKGENSR